MATPRPPQRQLLRPQQQQQSPFRFKQPQAQPQAEPTPQQLAAALRQPTEEELMIRQALGIAQGESYGAS